MKTFVIVPSHNQAEHIHSIIDAYDKQTVPPDAVVFVFDRCLDNSMELVKKMFPKNTKVFFTTTNDAIGFSAGKTRDVGIEFVERNFPEYETILFTDGDCIPSQKLIQIHKECLSQSNKAAVSCGRRVMKDMNGMIVEDERITASWINGYSFTNTNARLMVSKKVTLDAIFTYSCNLAFNRKAIELCKQINKTISNVSRVFNPEFDGSWGGEDNFISDCLFRTGNDILLTSLEGFVVHQYHTPAQRKDLHLKLKILRNLSQRLKTLILGFAIEGPVTEFEKVRNLSLMEEEWSNIFSTISVSDDILKIVNVINPTEYRDQLIGMFSRNVDFLPATDSRVKPNRISDVVIEKLKDLSAFTKVYLVNGAAVVESDFSEYQFKIEKSDSASLCRSCG